MNEDIISLIVQALIFTPIVLWYLKNLPDNYEGYTKPKATITKSRQFSYTLSDVSRPERSGFDWVGEELHRW